MMSFKSEHYLNKYHIGVTFICCSWRNKNPCKTLLVSGVQV